ncbi:DUF2937 family protein [Roseospirillum parvum]|uniref:DUF2937 family protein n=1 Tax=Roseospirillum parvum TaxID=83401 RepID=A0A1G8FYB8_9PROT|nr:DUF2937 family protein [Roseospirillum parvum]SDH87142.1 Protein of unknown function [Roseospirillum parvum]
MTAWLMRKLDNFFAALLAAGAGMLFSQTQAFLAAYLQRLGGHLDEAGVQLERVHAKAGAYAELSEASRLAVETELAARVGELQSAFAAISNADAFLRPAVFLRHVEPDIAFAALRHFTPALPLDPPGLVFTVVGMGLALLAWEVIKLPLAVLLAPPERRDDPPPRRRKSGNGGNGQKARREPALAPPPPAPKPAPRPKPDPLAQADPEALRAALKAVLAETPRKTPPDGPSLAPRPKAPPREP